MPETQQPIRPTDFAIFNELSARPLAPNDEAAIQWLGGVTDVLRKGLRLGLKRLKTRHDFRFSPITDGLTAEQVIQRLPEARRRVLLKAMSSPYLPSEHEDAFLMRRVIEAQAIPVTEAEGLLCAHILQALAVSFDSDPRWDCVQIPFRCIVEATAEVEENLLRHAAKPQHLLRHIKWASRAMGDPLRLTPRPEKPLRNTDISDLLVDDDWDAFLRKAQAAPNEKIALLRDTAEGVAHINGYDFDPALTAINRSREHIRQIFRSAFAGGRETLYLSTDFENAAGAFEVCDHGGHHLGEWLFCGRKNKPADTTGSHDIRLR